MNSPDPKNVRDALLQAGYSPATVDFMIAAGEKYEWLERDEDDNERHWETLAFEHGGVKYQRSRLTLITMRETSNG